MLVIFLENKMPRKRPKRTFRQRTFEVETEKKDFTATDRSIRLQNEAQVLLDLSFRDLKITIIQY